MLAVAQSGEISGYYRESQGEGVTKTCSFFLAGSASSDQVRIISGAGKSVPGMLMSEGDGAVLKIEKGRELPGCGLVLIPEIAQGITLSRTFEANWVMLRRIASPKAYFFRGPTAQQRLNAYLVKGDVVGVLSESDDWLNVEYVGNSGNSRTTGWIRSKDCEDLFAP